MVAAAYIHIPFCSHKCDFCDFAAFAGMDHLEDEYATILCREIEERLAASSTASAKDSLQSVFYGGGTPGLVKAQTLEKIQRTLVGSVGLRDGAEISLETTPHAITAEKVRSWSESGINRLSIGIESLQDRELTAIGRDHTRAQALEGVRVACESGCENVSCDFMYSLPTQTTESWQRTLNEFIELSQTFSQIKHVSAYGLHLANNSPLFSRFPKESPSYPDDEVFETMYSLLVETLAQAGFHQYEVSNFAKPGYQSVHNLTYWNNSEYYGFGVSAHRYVGGVRSSNWRSLARYMKDSTGTETQETIDRETRRREAIMLGLRMRAGIDLRQFEREFGKPLTTGLEKPLKKLLDAGLVELSHDRLTITHKGVPISNSIIAELI